MIGILSVVAISSSLVCDRRSNANAAQEKKAQEDREREQRIKEGEVAKGESAQEVCIPAPCTRAAHHVRAD